TLALFQRQPDTILALVRRFRAYGASQVVPSDLVYWAALAHVLRGDSAAARASFDSVVAAADSEEGARPDDWGVHFESGLALAALGRRTRALAEARWLEHSVPYRRDKARGPGAVADRAIILIWLGMNDAALAELERVLAEPSGVSVNELRISPLLDPIRHDPRFQALLRKYENRGAP
ncbi:MAG TPA: hypothetical protein VMU14_03775, partial [Acidimicrobiales bacterium]|nr:hypothetical protein [Acidimicrobiales bacterium]